MDYIIVVLVTIATSNIWTKTANTPGARACTPEKIRKKYSNCIEKYFLLCFVAKYDISAVK